MLQACGVCEQMTQPCEFVETYQGFNINKDNTVKPSKFYFVKRMRVIYGGSIDIIKRKIDRLIKGLK